MAYVSTAKASPHPPAQLAWWVVIPQHVAPNLELLFPKYFSGTYGISVQFFLIDPFFLTGWLRSFWREIQNFKLFPQNPTIWVSMDLPWPQQSFLRWLRPRGQILGPRAFWHQIKKSAFFPRNPTTWVSMDSPTPNQFCGDMDPGVQI